MLAISYVYKGCFEEERRKMKKKKKTKLCKVLAKEKTMTAERKKPPSLSPIILDGVDCVKKTVFLFLALVVIGFTFVVFLEMIVKSFNMVNINETVSVIDKLANVSVLHTLC